MIIIKIKGGIGNQLFQFSLGYALSKIHQQELFLDISNYKRDNKRKFELNNILLNQNINMKRPPYFIRLLDSKLINYLLKKLKIHKIKIFNWVYILQISNKSDRNIEILTSKSKNLFVNGYWQSGKYFNHYLDEVLETIKPNFKTSTQYSMYEKVIAKTTNSVSLHIRRGDYLLKNNQRYNVSDYYYQSAIDIVSTKFMNETYFIFTDDKTWAKEKYNTEKFIIVDIKGDNSDIEELLLMAKCSIHICSNSTFSWWGSIISKSNNSFVIFPDRPWDSEMIIDSWTILNSEGKTMNKGEEREKYDSNTCN